MNVYLFLIYFIFTYLKSTKALLSLVIHVSLLTKLEYAYIKNACTLNWLMISSCCTN